MSNLFRMLLMGMALSPFSGHMVEASTLDEVAVVAERSQESADRRGEPLTIDLLLKDLKAAMSEFKNNYTLIFESFSRQDASYKNPRALIYTNDAKLILSFNGHPGQRGFDEIEMLQFKKDSFTFQRLAVHNGRLKFFEPNERRCLGCHSRDPRPNWESYEVWPGVYQSREDRINGRTYALEIGQEHDGFESFIQNAKKSPRYGMLEGLEKTYGLETSREPNLRLTELINFHNSKRIARLMTMSKDYEKYKFAILAGIYGCGDIGSYLTSSKEFPNSFDHYFTQTNSELMDSENFFAWTSLLHVRKIASLRFLFENRGVSMNSWSTSFRDSTYAMASKVARLDQLLSSALIERDPELAPFRASRVTLDSSSSFGVKSVDIIDWQGGLESTFLPMCRKLKEEIFKGGI